jgi:hypothetical protein
MVVYTIARVISDDRALILTAASPIESLDFGKGAVDGIQNPAGSQIRRR